MQVRELIDFLQKQSPEATVVLWDNDTHDSPCVDKLGAGDARPVVLGTWEPNGVVILELWNPHEFTQDGLFRGVVLGAA